MICSSCHRPILWGLTVNKKRMPIDPRPAEGIKPNLVFVGERLPDGTRHVRVVPPGEGTHHAHFITCPKAKEHRRAR